MTNSGGLRNIQAPTMCFFRGWGIYECGSKSCSCVSQYTECGDRSVRVDRTQKDLFSPSFPELWDTLLLTFVSECKNCPSSKWSPVVNMAALAALTSPWLLKSLPFNIRHSQKSLWQPEEAPTIHHGYCCKPGVCFGWLCFSVGHTRCLVIALKNSVPHTFQFQKAPIRPRL